MHWVNLITVGFKFIFQIILKTLKYPSSWTGWHSDHLYHRFVEFRRLTERNIAIKEVNYEMCSSQDRFGVKRRFEHRKFQESVLLMFGFRKRMKVTYFVLE